MLPVDVLILQLKNDRWIYEEWDIDSNRIIKSTIEKLEDNE